MIRQTVATAPTELRSLLVELAEAAGEDVDLLWAEVSTPDEVREALMDVLPSLVLDYGDAAATVTAEWYDEYRADRDVTGRFTADVPDVTASGAEALAGWGADLVTPLDADWDAALTQIKGGMQKRIANAGRDTITNAVYLDPQGSGWQREARVSGCGFCQMLAGRATLYRERTTADFGAHDWCNCLAVPAFGGKAVPVKAYTPTSRTISDADRTRAREWIAANDPESRSTTGSGRSGGRQSAPNETKASIARRQLPGLQKSLADLRAKGLAEDSPQITYHKKQIARLKRDLT